MKIMNPRLKICIVTSNRADFGLLNNLINEINRYKKNFDLKIIVTGSHLFKSHGLTINEIIKNRQIKIFKKIEIYSTALHDANFISDALSKTIVKFQNIFKKYSNDIVVLLGDRYEILGVALAATINRIAIAHIHGGELTEGAIDDQIRHAITKFSHLHFVSAEEYKKRVIQLGEQPDTVHNVGALGLDSVINTKFFSKKEIEKILCIKFQKYFLIVTLHPETQKKGLTKNLIFQLLEALNQLKNTTIIFTMPGADLEYKIIKSEINKFIKKKNNAFFFKSLGQKLYLSCLKYSNGMIGNSSSGIFEMPYFGRGTINIGDRQKGRILMNSVINVNPVKQEILNAIKLIISKEFMLNKKSKKNIYGNGLAAKKIVNILKRIDLKNIRQKVFYNIN